MLKTFDENSYSNQLLQYNQLLECCNDAIQVAALQLVQFGINYAVGPNVFILLKPKGMCLFETTEGMCLFESAMGMRLLHLGSGKMERDTVQEMDQLSCYIIYLKQQRACVYFT